MILDEPLSVDVRLYAERALVRARNDDERAADVLSDMLRIRPDLLHDLAGAIVRSVQRAQVWEAQASKPAGEQS